MRDVSQPARCSFFTFVPVVDDIVVMDHNNVVGSFFTFIPVVDDIVVTDHNNVVCSFFTFVPVADDWITTMSSTTGTNVKKEPTTLL
jgi:hypothetical protein